MNRFRMHCYHLISATIVVVLLNLCFDDCVTAEVAKCHADCQSPASSRPVGPTRPWDVKDDLGNDLLLTRPYPYSIAGSPVTVVTFNITMTIHDLQVMNLTSQFVDEFHELLIYEEGILVDIIKTSLLVDFKSFEVEILSDHPEDEASYKRFNDYNVTAQVEINADHNGYNRTTATSFFVEEIRPGITQNIDSGLQNDIFIKYIPESHQIFDRSFSIGDQSSSFEIHSDISVENPNPYTLFCEIGCSIFFSLPETPVELVHCTDQCDELYKYNISVGYNDLAEVAKLECRDGCQMALKRCQPGYYCPQVKLHENKSSTTMGSLKNIAQENGVSYEGGFMAHCEAGTYRDVDYNSVESCVPCPPGRFREDIKGRNLESCSKCPASTYNKRNGSSTILDCLRCPAGTFTNQPGSEFCICITPAACSPDQLPSPADAEKKGTVPYIGRW